MSCEVDFTQDVVLILLSPMHTSDVSRVHIEHLEPGVYYAKVSKTYFHCDKGLTWHWSYRGEETTKYLRKEKSWFFNRERISQTLHPVLFGKRIYHGFASFA